MRDNTPFYISDINIEFIKNINVKKARIDLHKVQI